MVGLFFFYAEIFSLEYTYFLLSHTQTIYLFKNHSYMYSMYYVPLLSIVSRVGTHVIVATQFINCFIVSQIK